MATYYVNATTGLDTNDGLTSTSAFKTFQALLNSITGFVENSTINLDEGIYTCDRTLHNKIPAQITLTIIGKGSSTRLKPTTHWGQMTGSDYVGVAKSTLNICRLIFDMTNMVSVQNAQAIRGNFNLHNVVIDAPVAPSNSGAGMFSTTRDSVYKFYNCTSSNGYYITINSYDAIATLNNCYGKFQKASVTGAKDFVAINCFITSIPKLDIDYNITDENIPKTVGLYYGTYSWSTPILIKKDYQYFSINDIYYNTETKSYNPLSSFDYSQAFQLYKLFEPIAINGESFIPIEKFDRFKLVTSDLKDNYKIKAIETNLQLIVANDDIFTSVASNIDYFKIVSNQANKDSIKIALSTDSGATWNTWNETNHELEKLNCTIPLKKYNSMSAEELSQWDNAKVEIDTYGINIETFNSLNFNMLDIKTIRFAYVLNKPIYIETVDVTQLNWQFDAKGHLKLMKSTELDIDLYDHQIKVTSLIDNPIIKVNLMA